MASVFQAAQSVLQAHPHDGPSRVVSVELWGPLALFTRPEFHTERFTYFVPTHSALRGILSAIYWHPQIEYRILAVKVLNPFSHLQVTRNELERISSSSKALKLMEEGSSAEELVIPRSTIRQQRSSVFLRNVRYQVVAEIVPAPGVWDWEETQEQCVTKGHIIFERRVSKGQCFRTPYFGMRECRASFAPIQDPDAKSAFDKRNFDLGIMLYDCTYTPSGVFPEFQPHEMRNGIVIYPYWEEVFRRDFESAG